MGECANCKMLRMLNADGLCARCARSKVYLPNPEVRKE